MSLKASTKAVEGCDSCTGASLRIDGRCLLHYVASRHSLEEFREALREVEEADGLIAQRREARREFSKRARAVFPDRYVTPRFVGTAKTDYSGENIVWASAHNPETLHPDKHCHHLTDGSLSAYPASEAAEKIQNSIYGTPSPCPHCAAAGFGRKDVTEL